MHSTATGYPATTEGDAASLAATRVISRGFAWLLPQQRSDGASYSGCKRCHLLMNALDTDKASSSVEDGTQCSPWLHHGSNPSDNAQQQPCMLCSALGPLRKTAVLWT